MNPEQILEKIEKNQTKYPWVFWLTITLRRDWFSYWWHTRGANFLEIQCWIFRISIGMPWGENMKLAAYKDWGSVNQLKKTNDENLKPLFSFLIGKY